MAITSTLSTARTASWDKIGTDLSTASTLSEALVKAKLDFTVTKSPIYTPIDNVMTQVNSWCSTVGTDGKVRGVVRESYEIVNSADAVSILRYIAGLKDEGILIE